MNTGNQEEEAIKKIFGGKWGQTDTWQGALVGSLGSAGGNLANTLIGQGRTDNIGGKIGSGISNIGGAVGSALSAVNPLLGGAVSLASGLLGGGLTALVGADFNEENIADIENQNTINKNTEKQIDIKTVKPIRKLSAFSLKMLLVTLSTGFSTTCSSSS